MLCNTMEGMTYMWVITVFEENTYRMFEYRSKSEATTALHKFKQTALLSYTR
ncbi:hypothetical protein [Lysinibacillus sp. SG55]|jgi:hypothetical protein|uniref:hypothetical protein n=1 Tax=Lysinibacillus sp. SG55 TaxID=1500270 RepID=UPI001587B84B|nr:hypothetical protein [Lysinibacillus sp. SG55]